YRDRRSTDDPYFADATIHFQPYVDIAFVVEAVFPVIVFLFETGDGDAAKAAVRLGPDADALRQMNIGLANAAGDRHIVIAGGLTAQVEIDLPCAHMDFYAAQVEIAEIEVCLAGAAIDGQVEQHL